MTPSLPLKSALLGLLALSTLPALAAPVVGPSDASFYTPPAPLAAGAHGELIWYRPTTVNLGTGAPPVQAWNVLYRSTDALGAANVVTGTVIIPATVWTGSGQRPLLGYAVGTHGLAQRCAPSMQLAQGTDYENANIAAAVQAGYAVLVSDYPGYTTGASPTYLAGAAQGRAVLDLFPAALQIPNTGLSASAKAAIWGYSQGGQSAAWAGELKGSYAPGLNLAGVAAGGIPADFLSTAPYLDGSAGASFLLGAVIGLSTQYPTQIPINTLTNATGQTAIARGKAECVFEALPEFMNRKVSEYTVNNQSLTQLMAIPSINQTLKAQALGSTKIPVPLYQYHGTADEFIPLDQTVALKRAYCGKYANVTFGVYPGEHIATQFQAATPVLSWLNDRLAGKITLGTCLTLAAAPKANANPGGGDFVVSLKDWPLAGTIGLKTLKQSVALPATSTMTADTNISAKTLKGSLSIPDFTTNLKIAGLPADVKLSVTPTGPISGTASLDTVGQLHIHGTASVNITVVSAGEAALQIPFGCKTSAPVLMPIDFDGPVSALGSGALNFTGITTFPAMTDCGIYTSLFTSLMSGPGQTYAFSVRPPAPTVW